MSFGFLTRSMSWSILRRYLFVGITIIYVLAPSSAAQKKHHRRLRAIKADVSEKKISEKALPPEVLKSFKEKYPAAEITGQLKETREGIVYYEVESIDSAISRNILFQPDGAVVEVEESISPKELPQFIRDSVKVKYPDVTISSAERITRDKHIEYQLILADGKRKMEVVVNSAGKVFKIY